MPYIVTTKHRTEGLAADFYGPIKSESRRAVATLEEAVKTVWQMLPLDPVPAQAKAKINGLPESGGTIGPLPDGTVIEVRRAEWSELRLAIGLPRTGERHKTAEGETEILNAYDARGAS